eukprot:snap_masked-scaffold_30-processed-gene-2.46-mRNA-1 protein AED:1.00 eAED:1.00 QI:0/0/0/0/1/1/3/0/63
MVKFKILAGDLLFKVDSMFTATSWLIYVTSSSSGSWKTPSGLLRSDLRIIFMAAKVLRQPSFV